MLPHFSHKLTDVSEERDDSNSSLLPWKGGRIFWWYVGRFLIGSSPLDTRRLSSKRLIIPWYLDLWTLFLSVFASFPITYYLITSI